MAPRRAPISMFDFSGGLHQEKSNARLKDNELVAIDGFELSVEGALRKMIGTERYNETSLGSGSILGMHRHLHGDTPQFLVAHGTDIYLGDDGAGTLTSKYSSQTAGKDTYFDTWKDLAYIVNGTDAPRKWNGTTVSTLSNAPIGAKYVTHYADRLWMVVADDDVRYSKLLDPEVWKDEVTNIDNLIDVSPGDEQDITGLVAVQTHLVIFKSNSVYYLRGYNPDEWFLDDITRRLGCIAPRSILDIDGVIYFLSHRGVYTDDGRYFDRISKPVQESLDACSRAQLSTAVSSRYGRKYRLDLPDHPDGPLRLEYDLDAEEWTTRSMPFPIVASAAFDAAQDTGDVVLGSGDAGLVYYERGGTDDGVDITATAKTKRFGLPSSELVRLLRRLSAHAKLATGDAGTLRWYFDGSSTPAGSMTLQDGATRISGSMGYVFRDVEFEIEITGSGVGSLFEGFVADVYIKRERWA